MEQLVHMASISTQVTIAVALPAAAAGLVARVGPGRALVLGLYTRLFLRANPVSQRTVEVERVRRALSIVGRDYYVVVAGPPGVGKTCVVKTATEKTFGVVSVRVAAATAEHTIVNDVLAAVNRCSPRLELSASAWRVAWWHRFIFRTPITVVLRASERKPTQAFAALDSAARALTYDFGMRVVIDTAENALPDLAKSSRGIELEVPPMPRSVIEAMPELRELHAALQAADLADVVWACVGGAPAGYLQLRSRWIGAGKDSLEAIVQELARDLLQRAIKNRHKNVVANAQLEKLYDLFRQQDEVPDCLLKEWQLALPSPDKVLHTRRSVKRREFVLVPADAAMAIVLRFGLADTPTLQELKEMVRSMSSKEGE